MLRIPRIPKIVIIFWPQYLEFAGFGLLILTFGGIVMGKEKNNLTKI